MSNIVDYYAELNIDKDLGIGDINAVLAKLKRVWIQREVNQPEKSRKILSLIDDACEVFRTEASREKYDQNLADSKKEAPEAEDLADTQRKETAKKWFIQGLDYAISHQHDLAAESFDQALLYCRQGDSNYCSIHDRAASAYESVKNYTKAIDCINKAIIEDPQNLDYYQTKEHIYFAIKFEVMDNLEHGRPADIDALDFAVKNQREVLNYILQLGEKADSYKHITYALDELAATWYWDDPVDKALALQYVNRFIAMLKEVHEEYWENMFKDTQSYFVIRDKEEQGEQERDFHGYQGSSHPSVSGGGGCYIATAVYGSYDCPEVWALRRLRDYKFATHWAGRLFIKVYYATSPTFVKWFGRSRWFNMFWKKALDKVVYKIKETGISDAPYSD